VRALPGLLPHPERKKRGVCKIFFWGPFLLWPGKRKIAYASAAILVTSPQSWSHGGLGRDHSSLLTLFPSCVLSNPWGL